MWSDNHDVTMKNFIGMYYRSMVPKLDMAVVSDERLLSTNSLNPLITWSPGVTWQKNISFSKKQVVPKLDMMVVYDKQPPREIWWQIKNNIFCFCSICGFLTWQDYGKGSLSTIVLRYNNDQKNKKQYISQSVIDYDIRLAPV